jgi:hypothetical protein
LEIKGWKSNMIDRNREGIWLRPSNAEKCCSSREEEKFLFL